VTRLSHLLGTPVRTESGRSLGRVRDIRAVIRPRTVIVSGLVVGRIGFLERLGIGSPEAKGRTARRDLIPWNAVVRVTPNQVVVRDF
jgi:sporulation protein YlmC with PRC-barrel domain